MSDRNGHAPGTTMTAEREPATAAPAPFRGPLQGLAELSELLGGESPGSRRFLRGLALGALVGAAIAGSAIWQRRRKPER